MRPEILQRALLEINLALTALQIKNFRVASIDKEPSADRDVDFYVVRLASDAEPGKTFSVPV